MLHGSEANTELQKNCVLRQVLWEECKLKLSCLFLLEKFKHICCIDIVLDFSTPHMFSTGEFLNLKILYVTPKFWEHFGYILQQTTIYLEIGT